MRSTCFHHLRTSQSICKSIPLDDLLCLNIFSVWNELAKSLDRVSSVWYREKKEVREALDSFTRSLFSGKISNVGWEPEDGESDLRGLLRVLVIQTSGMVGHKGFVLNSFYLSNILCN
jgi:hypothetical protein